MTMLDLLRYIWNLCLIKYELDINVFVSLNCLFSFTVTSDLRISCLSEAMNKLAQVNSLSQNNVGILHIFIRFQGRSCKSGIAIFQWTVSRNYAYSLFKY